MGENKSSSDMRNGLNSLKGAAHSTLTRADVVVSLLRGLHRWSIIVSCICAVLLLTIVTAHAGNTHTISPQQWQSLTGDKAFGYVNETEKTQEHTARGNGAFAKFVIALFIFLESKVGLVMACILACFIPLYVIYRLFGDESSLLRKKKKKLNAEETDPAEENMDTTDWEQLATQAMQNNDMRMAVRYLYMRLLQLLQQHELIHYRNDKTNYDYYNELSNTNYNQLFKKLSRQYEFTWYGHYAISPEAYNEYTATLNNLKQQLA